MKKEKVKRTGKQPDNAVFHASDQAYLLTPDATHNPLALLYSGQSHSWRREGNAFELISTEHRLWFKFAAADVAEKTETNQTQFSADRSALSKNLVLPAMTREQADFWNHYFAFDQDYRPVLAGLAHDQTFQQIYPRVSYIRILKQDPYESLIEYILSANNNMPRIRRSLALLRNFYGEEREDAFGKFSLLPGPEKLAGLKAEELRQHCNAGYRDQALVSLGQAIVAGDFSVEEAGLLDDRALYRDLLRLYGVGDKVAQCVMLFGYGRLGAFPVDVWVEKIMKRFYPVEGMKRKEMATYAQKLYGPYAGYFQQLLFEYVRREHVEGGAGI